MSAEDFVRLFFDQSYEHVLAGGSRLLYRAGQFYHVAAADAEKFIAKGLAVAEIDLNKAAAAEEAEAATPSAEDLDRVAEEHQAAEVTQHE